jgi:hypothetical protein
LVYSDNGGTGGFEGGFFKEIPNFKKIRKVMKGYGAV